MCLQPVVSRSNTILGLQERTVERERQVTSEAITKPVTNIMVRWGVLWKHPKIWLYLPHLFPGFLHCHHRSPSCSRLFKLHQPLHASVFSVSVSLSSPSTLPGLIFPQTCAELLPYFTHTSLPRECPLLRGVPRSSLK